MFNQCHKYFKNFDMKKQQDFNEFLFFFNNFFQLTKNVEKILDKLVHLFLQVL